MVSPVESPEAVASDEVVIEDALESAQPQPDPWAEFDGLTEGTPVEATETPEATASEEPTAIEAVAATEAPAELPAPALDPTVAELRQRVADTQAQLAQLEARGREQEESANLQTAFAQRQKELEEQEGITPERARAIAEREVGAAWRAFQAERAAQNRVAEAEARVQVAIILAEQHKVPLTELLKHATLPAMQAAAQQLQAQSTQTAKITELETQLAKLTQGRIPPQAFSQGVTEGSGVRVTPDNIDELYLRDPSRYGAAYKKFLAAQGI